MKKHCFGACVAGALLVAANALAVEWSDPHSVVVAALNASPVIRSVDAEIAAAHARGRAAGALPNPMLMAGVQNQPVDLTSDPMMTMYMVGASQTFVRAERRESARRSAALDVRRLEGEAEVRRAEIAREVLGAYYEAAAAQSQIAAIEEIVSLANMTAEAARARYEVGAGAQIDIIRAKLEASNDRREELTKRRVRGAALARLRALLNLPPTEEIPPFELQHVMEASRNAEPAALESTPAGVAALESEVARAEEDIRQARLAARPDVNVEASYGFRPHQTAMFSLIGRIELPVRRSTTIEPMVAEATARREAARARIDVLRQQLRSGFGEALVQRNEAIEQIELHEKELVPEAKLGFESALASYQAGKTTFDSVLGALQAYRRLNVDFYEFLQQLLVAEAEIDALQHGATGGGAGATMGGAR